MARVTERWSLVPSFAITFLRINDHLTPVDCLCRQVDWEWMPHTGDSIEIIKDGPIRPVESVCYDDQGFPTVYLGPVMIDAEEASLLLNTDWRPMPLPLIT
jgi:hypothetical protein